MMARHSQDMPVWRVGATALAAFALGVQLLLSGFLIGQHAWAADSMPVICAHEQAGLVDDGGGPPGSAPGSHELCPACACPQSAQALATFPPSPSVALPLPRSEALT